MLEIDTSSRKEQRKFGLVMAAAIVVLGLIRFGLHGFSRFPTGFLVVAALFVVAALAWPRGLKPVLIVWMKFALVLNWLVTHLLLTFVYFVSIVPMGIGMRLFSADPLKRNWLPQEDSYWEAPEDQPENPDAYRNQF